MISAQIRAQVRLVCWSGYSQPNVLREQQTKVCTPHTC